MTHENFNWEQFHHGLLLDLSLDEAYHYLATPAGITSWFIGTAEYTNQAGHVRGKHDFAQTGDHFKWKWLAKDHTLTGTVLAAETDHLFRFTFGSDFVVDMHLKREHDRTLVTLTQFNNSPHKEGNFGYLNCCVCWVFFLSNLKSVAETGTDLRETQVDLEMLVNR